MQDIFFDNLARSRKAYNRAMEPVCQRWALTRAEADILRSLGLTPELDRVSDIVAVQSMTKSLVSMSIKHLEELGYVRRRPDENDRRIVHLELTEAAAPVVQDALQTQTAFYDTILEGVTQEELDLFLQLSQKVQRNLEKIQTN